MAPFAAIIVRTFFMFTRGAGTALSREVLEQMWQVFRRGHQGWRRIIAKAVVAYTINVGIASNGCAVTRYTCIRVENAVHRPPRCLSAVYVWRM